MYVTAEVCYLHTIAYIVFPKPFDGFYLVSV